MSALLKAFVLSLVWLKMNEGTSTAAASEGAGHGVEAEVPERVARCLKESKDFGQYKRTRSFKFVHLFAGPRDVLATSLRTECEKGGILLEVESYDKFMNQTHDLSAAEPLDGILNKAKNMECDGGHASFHCGSFSRARLNAKGDGPGPVRSGSEIYGLSTNNRRQQAEADKGTVLAVRSGLVIAEGVMAQRKRAVPTVGTLENPSGSETREEGPAWELPELKDFVERLEAATATFNTCAYQNKEKDRWFKPGRITGCLAELTSLSRKCTCPSGVKHQSLIGKALTARVAEHPEKLTKVYAVLVAKAFKTTLQMEWWRHQLRVKQEKVSAAQKNWIASKMKKQVPPTSLGDLASSKRSWTAENVDEDVVPSDGPSKRKRKEGENMHFVGGMRNPAKAVSRLHKLGEAGHDVRRLWMRFVRDHPEALEAASSYGSENCKLDAETLTAWRREIESFWKAKEFDDVVLKEPGRFTSPLDAKLWEGWRKFSSDPERDLVQWIRAGAPLGMAEDIRYSSIFPVTDEELPDPEGMPDMEAQLGFDNYKSFREEPEHARQEGERYLKKGFCMELDENEPKEQFPTGTISKWALNLKEKEDGTIKRRVIIDLLRSGGNSWCKVREGIVLPRIQDVLDSLKYLREHCFSIMLKAQKEEWPYADQCEEIELVSADLADAYCHLAVAKKELGNWAMPSIEPGRYLVFTAMLFSFKGAPLILGRCAARLARLLQALIPSEEMQSQLYMDDQRWMMQGARWRRRENLALISYMCGALGVNLQFMKDVRGTDTTWIGTRMELRLAEEVLILSIPHKMMNEVKKVLTSWESKGMVPLRDVRAVTGHLSWICGIITRARWCVNIPYTVIAQTMNDVKVETERASRRDDTRPKPHMVAVHRMELPRQWFLAMFDKTDEFALRHEPLFEVHPTFALITDASPQGVGATLADTDKTDKVLVPLEALEIPVTEEIAKWTGIQWKEASGQGPLEAWAVLMALREWKHRLKGCSVLIRSDSVVALATVRRSAAHSPVLNGIGAELALRAEELQLGLSWHNTCQGHGTRKLNG